tara:strand:+ start:85 stop:537 length:453 start_codon:yes stop_codon:yes gene_type:complete
MDYIFTTLLNRKPTSQEVFLLKNRNLQYIKMYIKDSGEFKNFYNSNLKKIEKIFCEILNQKSLLINTPQFMNIFVKNKYKIDIMKLYIQEYINNIKKEFKNFYLNYLDLEEQISMEELVDIINSNIKIQNYICNTNKFHNLCDMKINELN